MLKNRKQLSNDAIAEIVIAGLLIVGAIGFIILGLAAASGVKV